MLPLVILLAAREAWRLRKVQRPIVAALAAGVVVAGLASADVVIKRYEEVPLHVDPGFRATEDYLRLEPRAERIKFAEFLGGIRAVARKAGRSNRLRRHLGS